MPTVSACTTTKNLLTAAGYAVSSSGAISPALPSVAGSGTPASLTLTWPKTTIVQSGTVTPTVTVKSATGAVLSGTWVVNFTSSSTGVATVGATSGTVTGVALGSTTITGALAAPYASVTATQVIVVSTGVPTTLVLTYNATTLSVGGATATETDDVTDASGNTLPDITVDFTSSNTGVVTVGSTSGVVTPIAVGTATVTGVVSGYSTVTASVTFTVIPGTPSTVTITYSTTTVQVGTTGPTPTAVIKDSGGNTLSGYTVAYTSSNTAYATVGASTGTVVPVAAGSPDVVGTVNGYSGVTQTIPFTITAASSGSGSSGKIIPGAHAAGLRGTPTTDYTNASLVQAGFLRTVVPWYDTEPSSGTYSWTALDALVSQWGAKFKIVITDWASPSWANGGNSDGAFVPNYTTANAAYTTWYNYRMTYLSALFNRYKGKIWGYEYWNEPDQSSTGQWDATPDPDGYTYYVNGAHALHSSIDPHSGGGSYDFFGCLAGIGAGPTYSYGSSGIEFLDACWTFATAQSFGTLADGVSCHNYCNSQAPTTTTQYQDNFSDVALVRTAMNNNGMSSSGILVTEFGWSQSGLADATQASYITQAYGLFQSTYPYVIGGSYFQLQNTSAYPTANLITTSNTITPEGTSFQAVAAGLGY